MKKILLLTYYFPPSNFAGSYRTFSFAKYFHKFGYYPIVITRQSFDGAASMEDMAKDCGHEVVFKKYDGYEVYYLPYKSNLRDKLFVKYGNSKYVWFRKFLSFAELILQGFTLKVIPYKNLYYFAKDYLKKNKDIDYIISSGKPYQLFLFCHLLSKKFGVKWVADYRDQWNSWFKFNTYKKNFRQFAFYYFDSLLEKKWTHNVSFSITVSPVWAHNISQFINKKCQVVLNGYDDEIVDSIKHGGVKDKSNEFKIVYLGSLYDYQNVDIFLKAVCNLLEKERNIKCYFIGVANFSHNKNRILNIVEGYSTHFELTDRISQREAYELVNSANALLMIGYDTFKGVISSKVYEYLPWDKPILFCPSDNGILLELLKPYSKLFICNTVNEAEAAIQNLYDNMHPFLKECDNDTTFHKKFTREAQVENFARLLDEKS